MPRLNPRDPSLGFHADGTDDDCYDGAGIIVECYLPFREPMKDELRRNNNWWEKWHRGPKVESTSIWQFRDRILEHNLGKSHDLAFSYYIKKTKHIQENIKKWFRAFEGIRMRYDEFTVDSDGNIQKGTWRLRQEKASFKRNSALYIFNSADLVLGYRRKSDGKLFTTKEYTNKFYIELADNRLGFEKVVTQGYQVENVQPNSKQEKRLRYQYNQKYKQLDKRRKSELKSKSYSLLTKSEIERKQSKLEDQWKIESRGFNSESFRGEGYHGRKNKIT